MSTTPEYEAMKDCVPELRLSAKANLLQLGGELLAARLISEENEERLRNRTDGESSRAALLVSLVMNKVREDSRNYRKFVAILMKYRDQHDAVIRQLEDKYSIHTNRSSKESQESGLSPENYAGPLSIEQQPPHPTFGVTRSRAVCSSDLGHPHPMISLCLERNLHMDQNKKNPAEGAAKVFVDALNKATATFLQALQNHDPHNPFKMLLIGETGSGKTSLLNLLYNCGTVQALGCGFGKDGLEHFQQFNNTEYENARAISRESRTNQATLYNVQVSGLKLGIIDTPGFGDSRGIESDKHTARKIIDALRGEEYINCVCLIINGRQARVSARLRYVLTEMTALLPREFLNNVIVVFSNTTDPLDLNFDPQSLREYFGQPLQDQYIFFIENPYCQFEKAKAKIRQLGIEVIARSLQKPFEDTARVLSEMCNAIKDFPQIHTYRFVVLYEKKQSIESNVHELLMAYDNQIGLEASLKAAEVEVDAAVGSKTLNKDFRTTQHVTRVVVVQSAEHNLLCAYAHCHSNCQRYVWLPRSFDKDVLKTFQCMSNGYCCTCGHSYIHHYHAQCFFKEVSETKELVNKEMERKFEEAIDFEKQARLLYTELEKKKAASEAERDRLSKELLTKIALFEELSIARNYDKLIENQLAVIETRLEGTTGEECEQLRNTKKQLEKKLKAVKEAKSRTTA